MQDMSYKELQRRIEDAEKILVGIGDDFDMTEFLSNSPIYQNVCKEIAEAGCLWVMPYVNAFFIKDNIQLKAAYQNLGNLFENKDYFVVSVSMNGMLNLARLNPERIVEPCGTYHLVQKKIDDGYLIQPVNQNLLTEIEACINKEKNWKELQHTDVFNSLYAEPYAECGYQKQWQEYTKWLKQTVNKKLCVLELGSSMMFASVIRFRFEKIVALNNKAKFIRVNKRMYHIPEEISNKGEFVSKNAVDYMAEIAKV